MTRITMNIIEYSVEQGLSLEWEDDFRISVTVMEKDILISANNAGLVSLARHLLTLAQVALYQTTRMSILMI